MKRLTGIHFLIAVCLIFPLQFLLPGYTRFLYPAGSEYSDLTLSHYPNLVFIQKSLQETGSIPLWANTLFSGYPFAADPLSGLWYPFTWILLIMPQPFGYNLVTSLHLLIGAAGVLLVLRRYGIGIPGAILGAVTFECLPKLLGHYTAGHVTLVWAVSLTAWIVYTEMRYREQPGSLWRHGSGIVLGVIALADIRWAAYAGLLFTALRIVSILSCWFKDSTVESKPGHQLISSVIIMIRDISVNGLITLCISMILWLPLVQYSNLSTRSQMGLADRMIFSLPIDKLANLMVPEIAGNWELCVYVGALGFLSLLGLVFTRKRPVGSTFWLWVCLISLIWALGVHNPLMHLISGLPGFSLLRVPSRSLFIFGLSICFLIGFFCDLVIKGIALQKSSRRWIFAITVSLIIVAAAAGTITGKLSLNILWSAAMWFLIVVTLFLSERPNKISVPLVFGMLFCTQLLDLGGLTLIQGRFILPEDLPGTKPALVEWLVEQKGVFRVYSPSYSISQLDAAKAGLELADGIAPLHLQSYDRFMAKATGVNQTTYSVSIPPFQTGNPNTDNRAAIPSARLLGILNVRYLCSEFPVDAQGFAFIKQFGSTYIYENQYFRPRSWLQSTDALDEMGGNLMDAEIDFLSDSANDIQLRVTSDGGYLVLSEIVYPGWQVMVDHQSADLVAIGGLLRGVEIPGGTHEIFFQFRPVTVYIGASVSMVTIIAGILFFFLRKKRRGAHV